MKFKLTDQHYDLEVGTVVFGVGPAVPQPGQGQSLLVTLEEGDKTEGALRIVPVIKLEEFYA